MLKVIESGNIFDTTLEAIFCPVSVLKTATIPLQPEFEKRFPKEMALFRTSRGMTAGEAYYPIDIYGKKKAGRPKPILLFGVVCEGREPTQVGLLSLSLPKLAMRMSTWQVASIAFPSLGPEADQVIIEAFGNGKKDYELYRG